jgi:hypothetical protein
MLSALVGGSSAMATVKLRNLSTGGALVECDALPRKGASLQFERNGRLLGSQVMWAAGRLYGLRFEEPLQLDASLRPINEAKRHLPMVPKRPGLKCKPLSEKDRNLMERWATMGPTTIGD